MYIGGGLLLLLIVLFLVLRWATVRERVRPFGVRSDLGVRHGQVAELHRPEGESPDQAALFARDSGSARDESAPQGLGRRLAWMKLNAV